MIFADDGSGSYIPVAVEHKSLGALTREAAAPEDRSSLIPFTAKSSPIPSSPRAPIAVVPAPAPVDPPPPSKEVLESLMISTAAPAPFIGETVKDVKWIVLGGVAFVGLLGLVLVLK